MVEPCTNMFPARGCSPNHQFPSDRFREDAKLDFQFFKKSGGGMFYTDLNVDCKDNFLFDNLNLRTTLNFFVLSEKQELQPITINSPVIF